MNHCQILLHQLCSPPTSSLSFTDRGGSWPILPQRDLDHVASACRVKSPQVAFETMRELQPFRQPSVLSGNEQRLSEEVPRTMISLPFRVLSGPLFTLPAVIPYLNSLWIGPTGTWAHLLHLRLRLVCGDLAVVAFECRSSRCRKERDQGAALI